MARMGAEKGVAKMNRRQKVLIVMMSAGVLFFLAGVLLPFAFDRGVLLMIFGVVLVVITPMFAEFFE